MARVVLVLRPMGEAAKRSSGGGSHRPSEGLVPTIREFLPWHVIERKMAEREGAVPARSGPEEEVPDSGVYSNRDHRAMNDPLDAGAHVAEDDDAPENLSYKVYSLAELEARGINSNLSVSATRMSLAMMAQKPSPWADVWSSCITIGRLAETWASSPAPRAPIADVFRVPLHVLATDLRTALRQVSWRKVGTGVAIATATFLVLVFAVVTAADLTDDLKPARVAHMQSGDSYTNEIVAASHRPAEPVRADVRTAPVAAAPAAKVPPKDDDLEFSVESEPEPVAAVEPAARARAKSKKPAREVFIP